MTESWQITENDDEPRHVMIMIIWWAKHDCKKKQFNWMNRLGIRMLYHRLFFSVILFLFWFMVTYIGANIFSLNWFIFDEKKRQYSRKTRQIVLRNKKFAKNQNPSCPHWHLKIPSVDDVIPFVNDHKL